MPNIHVAFPKGLAQNASESLTKAFVGLPPDSIASSIFQCPPVVSLDDFLDELPYGPRLIASLHEDPLEGFTCDFEGIPSSSIISDAIFPEASRAQIKKLMLDAVGDTLHWSLDPLPMILGGVTGVRELSVAGYRNKCPFEAMTPSWKTSGSGTSLIWPCPRMEKLDLCWVDFTADKLLILIESRIPDAASISNLPVTPAPLRGLKVADNGLYTTAGPPMKVVEKIADIVGREGLVWENRRLDDSNRWFSV